MESFTLNFIQAYSLSEHKNSGMNKDRQKITKILIVTMISEVVAFPSINSAGMSCPYVMARCGGESSHRVRGNAANRG
ncbi:hypothetical protein CS537_04595 [Yersinia mollaretii]|nr:hypothetical protein CS537_04595 [Yersinia mollaretii]